MNQELCIFSENPCYGPYVSKIKGYISLEGCKVEVTSSRSSNKPKICIRRKPDSYVFCFTFWLLA